MGKPSLLIVADSPTVATGFATVAGNILEYLDQFWDISIVAINYTGHYHPLQSRYKFYMPTDIYGYDQIVAFIYVVQPEAVFIINDAWVCRNYLSKIRSRFSDLPVICYVPVDAENVAEQDAKLLNMANHVVCYTQFGKNELTQSGMVVPSNVIPHGVDTKTFFPIAKAFARDFLELPYDLYIVGIVSSNTLRKRLDLWIYILAEWLLQYPHDNVRVYLHGETKGHVHLETWIKTFSKKRYELVNMQQRVILTDDSLNRRLGGVDKEFLRYVYSSFDLYFSVAPEGWGLPAMEAMACGVPCLLPDYAAYTEWAKDAAMLIPVNPVPTIPGNNLNTMFRYPDVTTAIAALEYLYQHESMRMSVARNGYETTQESKFSWQVISEQFHTLLSEYKQEWKDNG